MNHKQTVLDYFALTFISHEPRRAAENYFHPEYRHRGRIEQSRQEFILFFEAHFRVFPQFTSSVKCCIGEGDLVVLSVHSQLSADDPGHEVAEFYRLREGKIFEHWHVIDSG